MLKQMFSFYSDLSVSKTGMQNRDWRIKNNAQFKTTEQSNFKQEQSEQT